LACLDVLITVKSQLNREDQAIAEEHIQNQFNSFIQKENNYNNFNGNNSIIIKEESNFDDSFNDLENYSNFDEMTNLDFGNNLF